MFTYFMSNNTSFDYNLCQSQTGEELLAGMAQAVRLSILAVVVYNRNANIIDD